MQNQLESKKHSPGFSNLINGTSNATYLFKDLRSNTLHYLKDFNSQSLAYPAERESN